jgi:hypothetical protein
MPVFYFLFLVFTCATHAQAQSPFKPDAWSYAQFITAQDIKKHVYVLASDSLEGRETGKPGQYKAAAYIRKHYETLGLKPTSTQEGSPSFYQNFNLEKITWLPSYLIQGKDTLVLFKDFYAKGEVLIPEETILTPIFLGYGIEEPSYSDYTHKNIVGKAVVIWPGEPMQGNTSLITGTATLSAWSSSWQKKALLAYAKGARLVIMVNPLPHELYLNAIKKMRDTRNGFSMGVESELSKDKALFLSEEQVCSLMGIDSSAVAAWKANPVQKKRVPKAAKKTVRLSIRGEVEKIPTQNVIGLLEGTDLKEEYIVISAHYDHLGKKEDGSIYYGADDDGSGTAAVLNMATAFTQAKKEGKGPRRSILFTAFTGEEMGLLGSNHYTQHPLFPLSNTIADLNIDMIGRIDEEHAGDSNYVYLIGSDRLSQELHTLSEQTNSTYTSLSLDYKYNDPADPNQLYYRSDHYNFAKNGIPVIFYFTGLPEDSHKITDTPDKLLYIKTSTISKLVFMTAWELAHQENRLHVDRK